jgi:hypothetical protein
MNTTIAAVKAPVRRKWGRIKFTIDGPWLTPPSEMTGAEYREWIIAMSDLHAPKCTIGPNERIGVNTGVRP